MSIEIKEYIGSKPKYVNAIKNDLNLTESYTVETYIDEDSLMVDMEALHSIITRNDTLYTPECIKKSIPLWTQPYERPVIMHHDDEAGITIGRVKAAKYIDHSERSNTPALELTVNIGEENGKKSIKNGTLATVSVGVIAHEAKCSICGQNLAEGFCEHEKGEVYEGKRCYWIITDIEPKEVSYVIVPSDIYAHNIRVYDAVNKKKTNKEVKESMSNIFDDLIKEHGLNNKVTDLTEGTQIDEKVPDTTKVNPTEKPEDDNKKEEKEDNTAKVEDNKEDFNKEDKNKEDKKEENKKFKTKDELNKELEDNTKEKEIENLKAEIQKLNAKIEELTAANAKLEKQVNSEKALKESAEAKLIEYKKKEKLALVESVNSLREQLELPKQEVDILMESTEESLTSTIKNLKEFVEVKNKPSNKLTMIESPISVSDEKDNTNKNKLDNVKESVNTSNKDFEKDLIGIFSKCFY